MRPTPRPSPGDANAAGPTLAVLERAASRAGRERTVVRAVRAAWSVLAADAAGPSALAAWRRSLGADGPMEGLFTAACLAAESAAAVAASLYRAARGPGDSALAGSPEVAR